MVYAETVQRKNTIYVKIHIEKQQNSKRNDNIRRHVA